MSFLRKTFPRTSLPGLALLLSLIAMSAFVAADTKATETAETGTVVMICEHGAVKSVIAAWLFDQEAEERGLPYRAISRGLDLYEAIPPKISKTLEADGFDVSSFTPEELTGEDLTSSKAVAAIGVDLSAFEESAGAKVQEWDEIPPASVDYEASKAAILTKVRALLDELEAASKP